MNRLERNGALALVGALLTSAVALAQAPDAEGVEPSAEATAEATEGETTEATEEATDAGETTEAGETEASGEGEPAAGDPSSEVGTTGSRVVNEQQQDLEREQREVEAAEAAEERQASGGVRVIDEPIEEEGRDFSSDNREHERMLALRIGAGIPYLVAIKYTDGSPCESADPMEEPESFCTRLGEPFLDLEIAWSFTNKIEAGAYVTLALSEDDAALAKPRIFGLGIRGYTSEQAIVKGFFGARVVLDLTNSNTDGFDDFDIGLHGGFGIQIEPIRWIGIYLQGGVSIRFLRNFTFLPEASGGLQFRFP